MKAALAALLLTACKVYLPACKPNEDLNNWRQTCARAQSEWLRRGH